MQHYSLKTKDPSVSSAILLTDGIVNFGQKPSLKILSPKYPIFTVGIGDSVEYPDLKVTSVISNDQVAKGNSFVAEVSVEAQNCNGNNTIIQILENNKIISQKQWNFHSKKDWAKFSFEITPQKVGYVQYTVSINPLNSGEKNTANNLKTFGLQVVEKNTKIHIVYSRPHPDVKAIQMALQYKNNFKVDAYPSSEGFKSDADVYILHGLSDFTKIAGLVNANKPIWQFVNSPAGLRFFSEVTHSDVKITNSFQWQEIQGVANPSFELFQNEVNPPKWKNLGAMNSPLLKLPANSNVQTQLYQCWNGVVTNFPLVCNFQEEKMRSLWLFGENIWKWRMNEFRKAGNSELFDDWVNKNILWLSNPISVQKELSIQLEQNTIEPGDDIWATIVHYNQLGQPENSRKINVFLIDSMGKKQTIPYSLQGNRYKLHHKLSAVGTFVLKAELADKSSVFDEKNIIAKSSNAEMSQTTADFNLLRTIAKSTRASFVTPSILSELYKKIRVSSIQKSRIISTYRNLMWNEIAWVLLCVTLLFSGEWFLRKWLGKI